MNAELVKVTNPDEIAAMPVEQRGQLITSALEESKGWLAVATKGTDPTPIAEFKAWAATVAEMTRQKGLAEEIQLDALEMVRRAERGIGVSIRNGQEAGEIKTQRDGGWGARNLHTANPSMKATTDFGLRSDQLSTEIYPVTDGITDEQHESALNEARGEKNLARANVIRKVQGIANGAMSTGEKVSKLQELAAAGNTSKQIAPHLGISDDRVRYIARTHDVEIPADKITARRHAINPKRIVQETVNALSGAEVGLSLLSSADFDGFSHSQICDWLDALGEPAKAIRRLIKELNARA